MRAPAAEPARLSAPLPGGDAAYARRCIDERLVPIFCVDEHLDRRSLGELRAHLAEHPQTLVICGHDAELWPSLQAVYD